MHAFIYLIVCLFFYFLFCRSIGMASHWFKYEENKKSGKLCKYAIAGSSLSKDGSMRYFDNLGRDDMKKLDDLWKTVEL